MKIGMSELILVFIVALIVIGPDKLPRYAKKLGEALSVFRQASDEATREIKKNIVEPLEEAQRPLREAVEPVEELHQAVQGNLKDVQNSLNQIGKTPPARSAPPVRESAAPEPPAETIPAESAAETEVAQ